MNRSTLNQLLNFFWTAVCFAGVIIYWSKALSLIPMYAFATISIIAGLLIPTRLYQLSRKPRYYEHLGVKSIRLLVQDGDFAKASGIGKQPAQQLIRNRTQAQKYLQTIAMYERYHLICLLLFALTGCHALIHEHIWLAIIITVSNIIYNICPMLLQQYKRARIRAMLG